MKFDRIISSDDRAEWLEARKLAGGMLADCVADGVPVTELGDLIAEYKNASK